ncbi:MAG: DegT/DnrJ/EryC1/StrS family aminotransferase [Myxococcales bacterium]
MSRILLSVPHMGDREEGFVREAFESNWLSTVGPQITAFEQEFGARLSLPAVALGSGTAAMHLGLRLLGVGAGDEVLCSTLTFVASANPLLYLGARPVFVDSELATWNLDPSLLADALARRAAKNRLPKAVVVVHLYGQCSDMDPILEVCNRYQVPVMEDAAEALGSLYKGKPAGSMGVVSAFSFNGNKIITTSGGGMLVSHRPDWVDRARFWSTQARDAGIAYEHSDVGYNYRLSNVLAAIGRGQLMVLDERVRQRRAVAARYQEALADIDGLSPMPEAPFGFHTRWLSCFLIDPKRTRVSRDELLAALAQDDIEARPVWKPMHMQPLFEDAEAIGGEVAEHLFHNGICLPSSSSLTLEDQQRVIASVRRRVGLAVR